MEAEQQGTLAFIYSIWNSRCHKHPLGGKTTHFLLTGTACHQAGIKVDRKLAREQEEEEKKDTEHPVEREEKRSTIFAQ